MDIQMKDMPGFNYINASGWARTDFELKSVQNVTPVNLVGALKTVYGQGSDQREHYLREGITYYINKFRQNNTDGIPAKRSDVSSFEVAKKNLENLLNEKQTINQ
jgi:hypothetical protein